MSRNQVINRENPANNQNDSVPFRSVLFCFVFSNPKKIELRVQLMTKGKKNEKNNSKTICFLWTCGWKAWAGPGGGESWSETASCARGPHSLLLFPLPARRLLRVWVVEGLLFYSTLLASCKQRRQETDNAVWHQPPHIHRSEVSEPSPEAGAEKRKRKVL